MAVSESDPDRVYAGTVGAGIQVSEDGGRSWRPTAGRLPEALATTTALAVDPWRPERLYVATQRALYRTLDGGVSWERRSALGVVRLIAVSPGSFDTLIFVRDGRLYRSEDGGATRERLRRGLPPSLVVHSLALDPADPALLYASLVAEGEPRRSGVYASTDGGSSWRPRLAIPEPSTVRVDPGDPRTLYTLHPSGVLRSVDRGATWRPVFRARLLDRQLHLLGPADAQGLCVVVQGRPALWCSADRGASFRRAGRLPEELAPTILAAAGGDGILAAENRDQGSGTLHFPGLLRSVDLGRTWQPANRGFFDSLLRTLTVADGHLVAGGLHGIQRQADDSTWQTVLPGVFVDDLAVAPDDPRTVYATGQRFTGEVGPVETFWKSTDAGHTWKPRLTTEVPGHRLAVDPTRPGTVYLSAHTASSPPWRSTDRGESWQPLPSGETLDPWELAVSPDGTTLYAPNGLALRASTDGGATWQDRLQLGETVTPSLVALSAGDPQAVYTDGATSRDGGLTWQPSTRLPDSLMSALVVDPVDPAVLYAAGESQLWRRRGEGPWEPLAPDLFDANVLEMHFDPADPRRLLAVVSGESVVELRVGGP